METHEIQSKTHLSIQYVYLGVKRNLSTETQIIINVIVCILLLHFSLQVPWEKFRKSYFCLQNCSNWVVEGLAILLPLHIYFYYCYHLLLDHLHNCFISLQTTSLGILQLLKDHKDFGSFNFFGIYCIQLVNLQGINRNSGWYCSEVKPNCKTSLVHHNPILFTEQTASSLAQLRTVRPLTRLQLA